MAEELLRVDHVTYTYDEAKNAAIDDVSLGVPAGQMLAVLGHNGSGKSTLAKLLNALLMPTAGSVTVCGLDTAREENLWEIRRRAGMVFQNPDNQIVATVVEEDVAFGLENTGVPQAEMPGRIARALADVGMSDFAARAPHTLSGGQKQRVAIAGILAMQPQVLILDEATAMLDPAGRREVMDTVRALNRERGITVLWITHFMEEAALCDRVVVMHEGRLRMDGAPQAVFSRVEELRGMRLDVPPMTALAAHLRREGVELPAGILTVSDMEKELVKRLCASK